MAPKAALSASIRWHKSLPVTRAADTGAPDSLGLQSPQTILVLMMPPASKKRQGFSPSVYIAGIIAKQRL